MSQIRQRFAQATLPYLYEIDLNQENIITSIGNNTNPTNRIRCEHRKTISRLANDGIHMEYDIKFIFNKILESKTEK